jgi:hypothetical protein
VDKEELVAQIGFVKGHGFSRAKWGTSEVGFSR